MRVVYLIILILIVSCKKEEPPVVVPAAYENGILVLNEGLFQQNNASMTFYSFSDNQSYQQVFLNENGRGLGDTANDMVYYTLDGEAYLLIVVDVSSQIEIVKAGTLESVAQIPLFDGNHAREPRKAVVSDDRAYICNFDGTVSILNLRTYQIDNTIAVGANPDGLKLVNQKLFVVNSGGLNVPVYDSTIAVIDIQSETVTNTVVTGINCGPILQDDQNDLYVLSRGNYADQSPKMYRINTTSEMVEETVEMNVGSWDYHENFIYYFDIDEEGIFRFNTTTETFEGIEFIDCSAFETLFKIRITANRIFLVDAHSYTSSSTIHCYSLQGDKMYDFTAGLNANSICVN